MNAETEELGRLTVLRISIMRGFNDVVEAIGLLVKNSSENSEETDADGH